MMRLVAEHASSFIREKWWLVANAVGVAAYVWLSSWTWLEPELRGEEVARAGDAMVWAMTAFPVLMSFALADVFWLIRRARKGQSLKPVVLTALLWVVALGICRALS
jgi:hypothetical protein